jgi:hypothetical protein
MRSLFKLLLRLARCSSGSALVEMTIIVPVAISLMAGGVDFGMALSTQATGSKSVRDAARYLASVPASAVCGWGLTNAQNLAVYGKLNPTLNNADPSQNDAPLITGWTIGTVTRPLPAGCTNPFTVIQLQATFPYNSIFLSPTLCTYLNFTCTNPFTLSAQHEEPWIGQ